MKMRTIRSILLLASVAVLRVCAADGGGEVLWWLVDTDYRNISGTTEDGGKMTAGELGVTDARIRYESDDGTSSGYLTLFSVGEDGSVSVYDGSAQLGADHGVGLPAEYFGDLSGLSGTAYSFVVELGNWIDGRWANTSMESERASYDQLVAAKHITAWENTVPAYGNPWSPDGYSVVPEPSGAMLTLVGWALLLLRRKRGV